MNQYEEQYIKRKENVINYLNEVISFFEKQQKKDTVMGLEKLKDNVEHNLFSIVLVGEFSAGKSTFLNALMHRKILPSFTSETTATVNFLRHKEEAPNGEAGIVYYNDGHKEILSDLSLKTIEKVVSTLGDKGDERVATTIERVDLFLESDFLKKGVMLVDSPGLNGVADNHREITEKQIKASHASIFMFSADHPGSKTDFEFVKELREQYGNQSNNIFYVLNKINVIRNDEGQSVENVIEDLKKSYGKQFPDDEYIPKIWPVAANAALVARDKDIKEYQGGEIVETQERRDELEKISRMKDFEERLWKYLTEGERTREQLLGPINTSMVELVEQRNSLKLQKDCLEKKESNEELIKQKEDLEQKLLDLDNEKNRITNPLSIKINNIIRDLNEKIGVDCKNIREKIVKEIELIDDLEVLNNYSNNVYKKVESKYKNLTKKIEKDLEYELLLAVQEECEQYYAEIESKLSNAEESSVIKIEISKYKPGKEDFENDNFKNNIEKNEAILENLQNQMNKVRLHIADLRKDSVKAKVIEQEIAEKEALIKDLKKSKVDLNASFTAPGVHYKDNYEWKKGSRGGILGGIAYIFVGSKKELVKEQIADTTSRDAAIREHNKNLEELDKEIEKIEKEKNNIKLNSEDIDRSESIEVEIEEQREKMEKIQKEYENRQKKFMEEMKKNSTRARKKMARAIEYYVEDCSDNFRETVDVYLKSQKKRYLELTKETFRSSIQKNIDKQRQKLDKIIEILNTEGKEREEKIQILTQNIEYVGTLLDKGIEIKADLDDNLKDTIEQEDLYA